MPGLVIVKDDQDKSANLFIMIIESWVMKDAALMNNPASNGEKAKIMASIDMASATSPNKGTTIKLAITVIILPVNAKKRFYLFSDLILTWVFFQR